MTAPVTHECDPRLLPGECLRCQRAAPVAPGTPEFSAVAAAIRAEIAEVGAALTALESGRPLVTTITIRWQGDPAALDAALARASAVVLCAVVPASVDPRLLLAAQILSAMLGDGSGEPPEGLGVARATSGGDGGECCDANCAVCGPDHPNAAACESLDGAA